MKKRSLLFALVFLILLVGCTEQESEQGVKKQLELHAEDHLDSFPLEDISTEELEALSITLNDEYKAEAIYQKVLDKFGEVRPFSNIIFAEKKHSDSLIEIYDRYNLSIPKDDWYDKVPEFDSITEACEAGVNAEIENAALYDELFSKVDNQDITAIFISLRDASLQNHLPAFQRCSSR